MNKNFKVLIQYSALLKVRKIQAWHYSKFLQVFALFAFFLLNCPGWSGNCNPPTTAAQSTEYKDHRCAARVQLFPGFVPTTGKPFNPLLKSVANRRERKQQCRELLTNLLWLLFASLHKDFDKHIPMQINCEDYNFPRQNTGHHSQHS